MNKYQKRNFPLKVISDDLFCHVNKKFKMSPVPFFPKEMYLDLFRNFKQ